MSIERIELPAKSRRPREHPPRYIIIHGTQGPTSIERQYAATVGWFQAGGDPRRHIGYGPSADILIGHDGREAWFTIDGEDYHTTRANWSAGYGASSWDTYGADEHGISIELAQTAAGERPTEATLEAAVKRCAALCLEYAIPPRRITELWQRRNEPVPRGIVGHEDTANGMKLGKFDPNKRTFPWDEFIAAIDEQVGGEMPASNGYIVSPGDTLTKIATHFQIAKADLIEWNGIADPDLIKVGQVLRLSPDAPMPALAVPEDRLNNAQGHVQVAQRLMAEAGRNAQTAVDIIAGLREQAAK